jgi:uncharacterized phage-associated protein
MRTNALSVANYFVELANRDGVELHQYGLIKRVYITHGISLAYYGRSALDPRYDRVEAWRNGPVIPSVYHSFKHNGTNPITVPCIITEYGDDGEIEVKTPVLRDPLIKEVADAVWSAYRHMSDREIIDLLHMKGTPWFECYEEGKTNEIPDLYTRGFYKGFMNEDDK